MAREKTTAWHDGVRTAIGWPVLAGVMTLAAGVGGFGAWAALAPLEGAVVAPGRVVAQGQNRAVQHLEGGIVKEILVEEGQMVAAGDPLLVLDGTASDANLNRLRIQLTTLEAIEARALAERDGAERIEFPENLLAVGHTPALTKVLQDQTKEFQLRLEKHQAELAILQRRIAALNEVIAGNEVERQETERQIGLIIEEQEGFEKLLEKGLARKSHVLQLKRTAADLQGRKGQLSAAIGESRQLIAEVEDEIERARRTRMEQASAELNQTRLRRSDVLEQIRAAEDISSRLLVRSPASGVVLNLKKYNAGAVVDPGQLLMEVVPSRVNLVVEAQVRPNDIDQVRLGQAARLHFLAFDQSRTPPVPGKVLYVSADRIKDERTGEAFYLVRLALPSQPAAALNQALSPGQPVEVFITTGERTFLSYLTEPIATTIRRAFRES